MASVLPLCAGAIPSLVGTLRQSSTAAAQQHAARALRNMAGRDNQNKLRAAQAGWCDGATSTSCKAVAPGPGGL